jgi:protein gp37
MQNTNIEWTDHTLNFWWGCTKVSPACTHCYAEQVAKVFGKRLFGTVPTWGAGQPRFQRLEAARKEALALNKRALKTAKQWDNEAAEFISRGSAPPTFKPRRPRIFVNSMSDWLDPEVPIEWLAYLLETIHLCPNLEFQLLTKRPENWRNRVYAATDTMVSFEARDINAKWACYDTPPRNVWSGTTVEDQTRADQRIPHLLEIPARIRFLSCEPLLGTVDIAAYLPVSAEGVSPSPSLPLHWVIAGGESGGQARPTHPDWFRSLRDQCAAAQVPFFFKQWGEWIAVDQLQQSHAASAPRSGYKGHKFEDDTLMLRAGTDHTGRLLDGHLHDQFPKV